MLAFFFVCFVVLIVLHYLKTFTFWYRKNVKGPIPFPLVGTLPYLFTDELRKLDYQNYKKYGPIYGDYMGYIPVLCISDPELAKLVLVTNFHIFNQSQKPRPGFGIFTKAVSTMHGPNWKRVRSAISPIFTTGKLRRTGKHLEVPMQNFFDNLVELIAKGQDDQAPIKHFTKGYALDVIAKFVFAMEINSYKHQNDKFVQNVYALIKLNPMLLMLSVLIPPFMAKKCTPSILNETAGKYFQSLTLQIIKQRRESPEVKYKDFIELLLENSDDLEQDEILAQVLLFFFAGLETISSALTILLGDIATYADVQEKILQEVNEAIGDDPLDYDNIYKLEYLDAVIHESLRMTPVLNRLTRHAQTDFELPGTEVKLKAGEMVMINVYAVHHNPNIYPDPFTYKPERFMGANKTDTRYWFPFGDGPRNCVGLRFALLEVKYFLIRLLQNYQIKFADGVANPIKYQVGNFFLEPIDFRLKFTPRNSSPSSPSSPSS